MFQYQNFLCVTIYIQIFKETTGQIPELTKTVIKLETYKHLSQSLLILGFVELAICLKSQIWDYSAKIGTNLVHFNRIFIENLLRFSMYFQDLPRIYYLISSRLNFPWNYRRYYYLVLFLRITITIKVQLDSSHLKWNEHMDKHRTIFIEKNHGFLYFFLRMSLILSTRTRISF